MAKVFLAGSGWFGMSAAEALLEAGHEIVGVCSPTEGRKGGSDFLASWAERTGQKWSDVTLLKPDQVPDGTDLLLTAHSHAFIGVRTRAKARYALGYHPSLLPLHRGRDAVKWQARLGERVSGGTIYHLTNRVDGGPIALQQHVIVEPDCDHSTLWRDYLAPLGLKMIVKAAALVDADKVPIRPQKDDWATWEPSFDSAPVYRPELLEIEGGEAWTRSK